MIKELFENEGDNPEPQIDTDEHRINDSNIGVLSCSFVVQIKKLRAEIDIKNKKGMRGRILEWFPVSRNRRDSLVDLHALVPCWVTHEWKTA